jgi:integrase/recombinase XerD
MVLGGLRRREVLGLRLGDLQVATRRVFVADGKGGHQRLVPVSSRFFTSVASYLDSERPADAYTDALFVVRKGPRRGRPFSAAGLDQILDSARERAGLPQVTCHQLRHTCLTRRGLRRPPQLRHQPTQSRPRPVADRNACQT